MSSKRKKTKNYYLDIRNNVFHIVYDEIEKCEDLRKGYIQEVTGREDEILSKKENGKRKFIICKKCEEKYNKIFEN